MAAFMDWALEFSSGIPVYKQIENFLYLEIGRGNLREGDRLPTIKELADRFKINPNTVAKAYRDLDIKGVIESRRGDGSFVSVQNGPAKRLTQAQRKAKLDELLGRVIAEAKASGIHEEDLLKYISERMREDE